MSLGTFDLMCDAKFRRDAIREELIKTLLRRGDLPAEIVELLAADTSVTAQFASFVEAHAQDEGFLIVDEEPIGVPVCVVQPQQEKAA